MKETPYSTLLNLVSTGQPENEQSADERIWDELFSRPESEVLLERLANEALEAFHSGETMNIDPGTA